MITHEEFKAELLSDPSVKAEYEVLEDEIKERFMSLCEAEFLDLGLASSFFSERVKHVVNARDPAHELFCDYKTYMTLKPGR